LAALRGFKIKKELQNKKLSTLKPKLETVKNCQPDNIFILASINRTVNYQKNGVW
jgi:hypothetical protein